MSTDGEPSNHVSNDATGGKIAVTINGSPLDVPSDLSVRELVVHVGLGDGPVAVEINRANVPRAEHATHRVNDGDAIEIVHFVGGG
jgi:thiamine biosynthesis protein ThiS